jgi:hypothetical protein
MLCMVTDHHSAGVDKKRHPEWARPYVGKNRNVKLKPDYGLLTVSVAVAKALVPGYVILIE